MTKTKKSTTAKKKNNEINKEQFTLDKYIPKKYQPPFAIAIILIVFLIFFSPLYFGNKTFQSGDIITIKSMQQYAQQDKEGFTLWNPYIFGGIPAYVTSTAYRWWDFLGGIYSYGKHIFGQIFSVSYAMHTINLMLIAFTAFFFMRSRKASIMVGLFVALVTAFSTGIVVFLFIGHITKMISLAAFPLILMMLLRFNEKIKLLDVLIMTIFLHFVVLGIHVQIIFYIFLSVAIFYIYYLIRALRLKDNHLVKQLFKSAGIFVAASLIAVFMSFDSYAQLWEYNKYSTRGTESILEKEQAPTSKNKSDFYEYATNWSFSPGEVLTFIVPSYYGFGNSTYEGPLTNGQPVKVNTYFGQMPFVDVAMYMGVVVFFLALLSIVINWKKPFIRYLTILIIFSLIISFGRNFSILYDLFYYYVPFFDKFRVPSMILTIVQMTLPILAGYGIMSIIKLRKEPNEKIKNLIRNTMFVFAGLFVLSLLLNSAISSWFISRVQEAGQKGQQLKPLYDYMAQMFTGDLMINMALAALTFGAAYAFIQKKVSADLMVTVIIVFALIDLFRIDTRGADYVDSQNMEQLFQTPTYISVIKQQKDGKPYRIVNFMEEGLGSVRQNSNFNVYFLEQDLSGYSGVKPRTYQDYMDVVGPYNQTLWRMLNVKYLAFSQPVNVSGFRLLYSNEKTFVYENEYALPRAYFVDSVAQKNSLEILQGVKNNSFDPKKIAFLEDQDLDVDKPDSTAYLNIAEYKDEYIKLDVNASGQNFLFLGDTYYPFGWEAFVDGNETEIYKTNHGFRGIVVPEGLHKVEFRYVPESFFIGKYVSLIINILLIGFFIFALIKSKIKTPESQL